jgi:hypothetical protein
MAFDIQLTVIIYKKKKYISHIAALSLSEPLKDAPIVVFGNRMLVEVKPAYKHLIEGFPVYDMDSMLQSFVEPDKTAEVCKANKKDCFEFDGMTFISLAKLNSHDKYRLRFSLAAVKIFGTYYILCNKQKDVNTRIVVKPE